MIAFISEANHMGVCMNHTPNHPFFGLLEYGLSVRTLVQKKKCSHYPNEQPGTQCVCVKPVLCQRQFNYLMFFILCKIWCILYVNKLKWTPTASIKAPYSADNFNTINYIKLQ